MVTNLLRLTMLAAAVCATVQPVAAAPPAGNLREREQEKRRDFVRNVEQLAQWCDSRGLREQAQRTRWLLKGADHGDTLWVNLLPEKVAAETPPADASADVKDWHRRFAEHRKKFADELFRLAFSAVKAGHVSYGYDLVYEVADLNPDHPNARALLGYTKYKDRWVTPYQAERMRKGWVLHERYGWLKRNQVERYEQGQRWYDNKWIRAEEEASLRRELRNGWEVRTEHYLVLTNHSLEEGVKLASRMEDLYRVFFRVFAGFLTPQEQAARLFEGREQTLAANSHVFRVVFFRSRDEYMKQPALRSILGENIKISAGAYIPGQRTAFFFYDPEDDGTTLLHEGTHQLFSESRGDPQPVGERGNFWLVEGIACYMESMRREGQRVGIGGTTVPRMEDAKYRRLKEGFHIPLATLTRWDIEQFQRFGELQALYSQCAGLTHFLMHGGDGRYREPLVRYLTAVYTQRDDPQTLAELTSDDYAELDQRYREFLEASR